MDLSSNNLPCLKACETLPRFFPPCCAWEFLLFGGMGEGRGEVLFIAKILGDFVSVKSQLIVITGREVHFLLCRSGTSAVFLRVIFYIY